MMTEKWNSGSGGYWQQESRTDYAYDTHWHMQSEASYVNEGSLANKQFLLTYNYTLGDQVKQINTQIRPSDGLGFGYPTLLLERQSITLATIPELSVASALI